MFWQSNVCFEFGPFRLETGERRLLRDGRLVPLTPKVLDILLALIQHRGHILTKDELMKLVWPDTSVEEGNVARNISTLRFALGERSAGRRFIETIPWRGYRFVEEVREFHEGRARKNVDSIAVLPFGNVDCESDLAFLCEGITESLINSLSQLKGLRVMSRNSIMRYAGRNLDASEVGRDLKVDAVVFGRIARNNEVVTISLELVDTQDDSHLWGAQHFRRDSDSDLLSMPAKIAREISEQLRLKLTNEEQRRLSRTHTENVEAYQLFLKGRFFFNKLTMDGIERAIDYFCAAIERDSQYALAYAGLADCYNYSAKPADAREVLTRALELDDELGEAHASLGFFRFLYDWDFAGAENEFLRAIALNPNYAEAHHWYAIYLANCGRHIEAASEAKIAVERDPLSLLMNMTAALNFYLAREFDHATAQLQKVLDMEPRFAVANSVLGNVYVQKKLYAEAIAEYKNAFALSRGVPSVENSLKVLMAQAYAHWGKCKEAISLIAEVGSGGPSSPYSLAGAYAALGKLDEAFAALEKAFDEHDMQMVSLLVDPSLDCLREDPRFTRLAKLVGLPSTVH